VKSRKSITYYCGCDTHRGAVTEDREIARAFAESMAGEGLECDAYFAWLRERTKALVAAWEAALAIPEIAVALLQRRTIPVDAM